MIGRKQWTREEEWWSALDEIWSRVRREELDRAVEWAIEGILVESRGKRVAFAWSGGKDSLVLEGLCRAAGVTACVMGICELEYPAFLGWVTDHMPRELEIRNVGYDLTWLSQHEDWLFPQTGRAASRWFQAIQHRVQRDYIRTYGIDVLITGRRRWDGNFVGKGGRYRGRDGVLRYSPMADWSHEWVLAYLVEEGIELPPIYRWPKGFRVGTGPWAARQWTGSVEQGWAEVYAIDRTIVEGAAEVMASARRWLGGVR
jgi:3'-phosphoadenosine 5'-phosphosulfate sulfotransferase (PAPS reductase)/FAD synthetase